MGSLILLFPQFLSKNLNLVVTLVFWFNYNLFQELQLHFIFCHNDSYSSQFSSLVAEWPTITMEIASRLQRLLAMKVFKTLKSLVMEISY